MMTNFKSLFFTSIFFFNSLIAEQAKIEVFKHQANKGSDFIKTKSKEIAKWAKEHKKSSAVIGVSLFGAVRLLKESKDLCTCVVHSTTAGTAGCLGLLENLLLKINSPKFNKYLIKLFEHIYEGIHSIDSLLNVIADLKE